MNWGALSVTLGLIGVAFLTMPYGIIILVAIAVLYSRG